MKFEKNPNINKSKSQEIKDDNKYFEPKKDLLKEIKSDLNYKDTPQQENKIPEDKFAKEEEEKENREYEALKNMTDEEFIKDQKEELARIAKLKSEKNALTIKDLTGKNFLDKDL